MASNAIDHFYYFEKVPVLAHVPVYILHAALVAGVLSLAAFLASRSLKNPRENVLPEAKLSLKTLFELATEFVLNLMRPLLGDHAAKYVPLIGSIFLFIFFSNVLGLIPGFQPPTTSLNTNLAVGITVFLYYNYMGFKEHGPGYIKHFFGPIWWIAPVIFVVEMLGHLFRPLSLSLRLSGNMRGDHDVLNIFSNLFSFWTPIPVIFLGLGLFVCLMQAFIFSLLSVIYLALAVEHEHGHESNPAH